MERSNTCNKLKQGSMSYKLKGSPWDLRNDGVGNCSYWKEADLAAAGFSWPPRSYTCTFCKREFRSAQALGGHMNVHRRDRARLRLSPNLGGNKTLNLDLNPTTLNPNPNNLSSLFTKFPQFSSALPPICPYNPMTRLSSKGSFSVERFRSSEVEKGCDRVFKKGEQLVRLDLEIGLISPSEELDLELRLGYT